jgi:hypothetical protein
MSAGVTLVALLVVSTVAFVTGVSIERSEGDSHAESATSIAPRESAETGEEHTGEAAGSEAAQAGETAAQNERSERDALFGIDLEAAPFVVLAAGLSLAVAVAVWLRAPWGPLLALVAVAMALFAPLDVRELFHQIDESKTGSPRSRRSSPRCIWQRRRSPPAPPRRRSLPRRGPEGSGTPLRRRRGQWRLRRGRRRAVHAGDGGLGA